ncbi:MAG: 5-carboxymethyl-2-hydroxymuconate Delta-isomerase [Acidimicrobiaceae bacterium]|nr:5-carboxymethyl-2-hydroxymuconate Delta-isomerase [Acidimicrobiaceae bacterium]MYH76857.1 5-carboxymethyl-2-hydroxymuconate Delta-isomerase [Acidimicrobiaceae bacterium]MYK76042.1 5-carboxymethyl-2-hydroxymuconate Delta-isomerase [Acidimicrobiaceae bacterium]
MPHIIIEHSANVADLTDMDALVAAVHQAALDDGLPALDALRTRAAPRDHYRIADGDPAYGFVYLTARIGPGREPETIQRFLNRLIDTVDEVLAPHQPDHPVAISAEVQLIDPTMRINRNHIRTHLARGDRT